MRSDTLPVSGRTLSAADVRALDAGRPAAAPDELAGWLDAARRHGELPVLRTGPADTVGAAAARLLAVSGLLGDVLPQGFDGELVREVRDRNRTLAEPTARYSDTRQGGDLHTDGFHRPGPVPDVFALHCHRPAAAGGALVLVPVADVLDRLGDDIRETLTEPYLVDTRAGDGDGPPTVTRPVLDLTGDAPRIHYLRRYIASTADGSPPGGRHERAFDELDRVLADESLHHHAMLGAGETVFVDNLAYVHGRTEFTDHPSAERARLLLRTWIRIDGARGQA